MRLASEAAAETLLWKVRPNGCSVALHGWVSQAGRKTEDFIFTHPLQDFFFFLKDVPRQKIDVLTQDTLI